VSKQFRAGKTRVRVNGTEIGGDEFVVMAGPCSVESEAQIMRAAEGVAAAGAKILRGGASSRGLLRMTFRAWKKKG